MREDRRQKGRGVQGVFLVVFCLAVVAVGVWLAVNPPLPDRPGVRAEDASRTPGFVIVGVGLVLGAATLRAPVKRRRAARESDTTLRVPTTFLQPGETIEAHVNSPQAGQVLQLVCVQHYTERNPSIGVNKSSRHQSRNSLHELISLQAVDLTPLVATARFQITADAPATYLGEIVQIEHWLQVVPAHRARKQRYQVDVLDQVVVLVAPT